MFDTMTMTKAVGAVCGSLLVFLLIGWAATALFYTSADGHGGAWRERAGLSDRHRIGGGRGRSAPRPARAFATLLAAADAGGGREGLHQVQGLPQGRRHERHRPAPERCGRTAPRPRSRALPIPKRCWRWRATAWTPDNLNAFLENPKGYVPGTKMTFAGLPKPEDRANVIAYLATQP